MTKTYAETRGEKPFDWNQFLKDAIAMNLGIGDGLVAEAQERVIHWVTCACGNLCDAIPRYNDWLPKDSKLAFYGGIFTSRVLFCLWDEAQQVLEDIEKRSTEILTEMGLCPANSTSAS